MHVVLRELSNAVRAYRALPLYRLMLFPVMTFLALAMTWSVIGIKVSNARQEAFQEGLRRAGDVAHTFEQYSGRSVRQMDQVTRFVAFAFREHGHDVPLESLTNNVLVSPAAPALLSLADEHGMVYASSKPGFAVVSIADREHFQMVRDHPNMGLFVGKPVRGRVSNQVTVQIARRLSYVDGTFGGVVVVSMSPGVFTSFYNHDEMGDDGFLGLVGLDGVFRAARSGAKEEAGQTVLNQALTTQTSGTMLVPGHRTHDGQPRFVGWRRLDGYPLVAVVGLSEKEVMKDFNEVTTTWLRFGILGSIALLALGGLGGVIYVRLALRRQASAQAKQAYRMASEGTQDGFFILQAVRDDERRVIDFAITDVNDQGALMMGVSPCVLTGTSLSEWFTGPLGERLLRRYAQSLSSGRTFDQAEVYVDCDSPLQGRWLSHRVVPAPLGLAVTVRDITKIKNHEDSLTWLANHDSVTQLNNRTWLQQNLPTMLTSAEHNQHQVALFFVDLDDFKKVNDTLGHAAGDELLRIVGDRLRALSRTNDVVCRLGGDEFTLVASGGLTEEALMGIGQRIVQSLGQPMDINGQTVTVGASVGVSIFPNHGHDTETLLQRADLAMYQAKSLGKGACEFFQTSLATNADARLLLEHDLRAAIERDELFLVYQPKVNLQNQRIQGMEALLRWRSPTRGMVSPLEFIGLAERTGLILPIGAMVIDQACAQVAAWRAQGYTVPPVSVNVSPRQLHRVDLAAQLHAALERHGLDSSAIEVEITESSMMEDPDLSHQRLQALKTLGARILVDDFGTGYSSLAMLKRFEVDVLKVDRSFVMDVPHDVEDCAILQAVVSMAKALNMTVVAEGIETQEQCDFLRQLGCDEGQGYWFSRPVEAPALLALLDADALLDQPRTTTA